MRETGGPLPLLWQLRASHYSEKVRWALDHKQVPHRRRSPLPGLHMLVALGRSGGAAATLPLLELGEVRIADSTAAIAALEQRFPQRPLYPADPAERRRALALEEHFDEALGPNARLLVFHEMRSDPAVFAEFAVHSAPHLAPVRPMLGGYARVFTALRYGVADPAAGDRARAGVLAALDRLEAELAGGDGEHLVGGSFTVADLAAAALFYPVVGPEGGPLPADLPRPSALAEFVDGIRDRPGFQWVERTYERYRSLPSRAPAPA
jgi:glutathione S-transferase